VSFAAGQLLDAHGPGQRLLNVRPVDERQLRKKLTPERSLFEVSPGSDRTIGPVGVAAPSPPDGTAVRRMPTLDENDRRQIAGGDDFLHGPDIGPPRLGQ
jgi:hypothetical protein